jgi:hypothetical protein
MDRGRRSLRPVVPGHGCSPFAFDREAARSMGALGGL